MQLPQAHGDVQLQHTVYLCSRYVSNDLADGKPTMLRGVIKNEGTVRGDVKEV